VSNADGRREVLGMGIGASEAETFWLDFLRKLKRRGRAGVKLVIAERFETTEKINDVQRRMLEAAARCFRDRDELSERLRDGRF